MMVLRSAILVRRYFVRCMGMMRQANVPAKAKALKDNKEKFVQKSCRVAVLGAHTLTGRSLALLLKQNPLISQIFLHDNEQTWGLAADLNHLDTHAVVTGYSPTDLNAAIRNADVITLIGLEKIKADSTFKQMLDSEGQRLVDMASAAASQVPKAVFVNCVIPLSITLPIVSEIYRRYHWYHPGKVLGSVAQQQMQINTVLAHHQNLDPSYVHVPLLGGPEMDIMLPLFSRSRPKPVPLPAATAMINTFRKLEADAAPYAKSEAKHEYAPLGNAFAINRLISTIALGMLGDSKAISTAFVRTNVTGACRHLVSTVKFGQHGITHNYGVPKLTRFELKCFEQTALELDRREQFAKTFLDSIDNHMHEQRKPNVGPAYFPANIEFFPPDEARLYDV